MIGRTPNVQTSVDFEARIWLFDNTIHEVEVWVYELVPIDRMRRGAGEWIRESIRDCCTAADLYREFRLSDRHPGTDDYSGFQIVCMGNITGWYCQPYNEWDENIGFDPDSIKSQIVPDDWFLNT